MSNHWLPFHQSEGAIHLPSVWVINGVRMTRLPKKKGPKPRHNAKEVDRAEC